jgi:hypothetical protein
MEPIKSNIDWSELKAKEQNVIDLLCDNDDETLVDTDVDDSVTGTYIEEAFDLCSSTEEEDDCDEHEQVFDTSFLTNARPAHHGLPNGSTNAGHSSSSIQLLNSTAFHPYSNGESAGSSFLATAEASTFRSRPSKCKPKANILAGLIPKMPYPGATNGVSARNFCQQDTYHGPSPQNPSTPSSVAFKESMVTHKPPSSNIASHDASTVLICAMCALQPSLDPPSLKAWWAEEESKNADPTISEHLSFGSPEKYINHFFGLLLEECRSGCLAELYECTANAGGMSTSGGTLTQVMDESAPVPLSPTPFPDQCDQTSLGSPHRDGSMLEVGIRLSDGRNFCTFCSGDLLILRSSDWEGLRLGVVGSLAKDYQHGTLEHDLRVPFERGSSGEVLRVLVCQNSHQGSDPALQHVGGWMRYNDPLIVNRTKISATKIGCTLTFQRECTALWALRHVHRDIKSYVLGSGAARHPENSAVEHPGIAQHSAQWRDKTTDEGSLWAAVSTSLNASQQKALREVCTGLASRGKGGKGAFTLLHGPPGTGKTSVIISAIALLLGPIRRRGVPIGCPGAIAIAVAANGSHRAQPGTGRTTVENEEVGQPHKSAFRSRPEVFFSAAFLAPARALIRSRRTCSHRVLLCAPSNTAVDECVLRLIDGGIMGSNGTKRSDIVVLRLGQAGGQKNKVNSSDPVPKAAAALTDCSGQGRVNRHTLATWSALLKQAYIDEGRRVPSPRVLMEEALRRADVICCTLSVAGSHQMREMKRKWGDDFTFDSVIVDEAAQATEPSVLIPLVLEPKSVVMVGDPRQLPATLLSESTRRRGYGRSMFQRFELLGHGVHMLDTQYRMHKQIADFPSSVFYHDRLLTDPSVMTRPEPAFYADERFRPFVFHDICDGEEEIVGRGGIRNSREVQYIRALFDSLARDFGASKGAVGFDIGVMTPYSEQANALKSCFQDCGQSVEVATVDGFQGREKDIVILSCVRAPRRNGSGEQTKSHGIGFLRAPQRLNVALTRAKTALWVVGHAQTLSGALANNPNSACALWKDFVEYAHRENATISTSYSSGQKGSLVQGTEHSDNSRVRSTKRQKRKKGV